MRRLDRRETASLVARQAAFTHRYCFPYKVLPWMQQGQPAGERYAPRPSPVERAQQGAAEQRKAERARQRAAEAALAAAAEESYLDSQAAAGLRARSEAATARAATAAQSGAAKGACVEEWSHGTCFP